MKIAYLIATFAGLERGPFKMSSAPPHPQEYLRKNLEQLVKADHNKLDIILITQAFANPSFPSYYLIEEFRNQLPPISFLPLENKGQSYFQWLNIFFNYDYDYYIFVEDDYFLSHKNSVQLLIEEFKKGRTNSTNYLCCFVGGGTGSPYPLHAAHSCGVTDYQSIVKIREKYKSPESLFNSGLFNYKPEIYQIRFSEMFNNIFDFKDSFIPIYWNSSGEQLVEWVSKEKNPSEYLISPAQVLFQENLDKKVRVYV